MRFKILSALALVSVVAYAAVAPPRTITADIIRTVGGLRVFWTLPNQLNDTFVGVSTPQTLANKVIDGSQNTVINVPTSSFSGVNAVGNGGTGLASVLANTVPYGNGTGALNVTNVGVHDQVLKINSAGVPIFGIVNLANSVSVGTSVLPVANGGTSNGALPVTAGGLISSDGTKLTNIGAGTAGQIPIANGAGGVSWSNNTLSKQMFTSTQFPTTNAYAMWVNTNSATAGATYSAVNGSVCTVLTTVASSNRIVMTCTGAPNTSGTLTKTSGTGDTTITLSVWQVMGTYTTPANAHMIKVYLTGGGGGSSGVTTGVTSAAAASGGSGGATTIKWISNPQASYYYNVGVGGIATSGQPTQHGFPSMFVSTDGSQFYIGDSGAHGGSCGPTTTICANGGSTAFTGSIGDIVIPPNISGTALVLATAHACAGAGGGTYFCGGTVGGCDFTGPGVAPASTCYGGGATGAMLISAGASQVGAAGMSGLVLVEEYY